MYLNKKYLLAVGVAVSVLASAGAYAATTATVTANVAFQTALSIATTQNINFGVVAAGVATDYTISTGGSITPGANGEVVDNTGAQGGILRIAGEQGRNFQYSVGNAVDNKGVSITATTCNYNGGGLGACPTSGSPATVQAESAGADLLMGATISVPSMTAGDSAAPTVDVTVIYS